MQGVEINETKKNIQIMKEKVISKNELYTPRWITQIQCHSGEKQVMEVIHQIIPFM